MEENKVMDQNLENAEGAKEAAEEMPGKMNWGAVALFTAVVGGIGFGAYKLTKTIKKKKAAKIHRKEVQASLDGALEDDFEDEDFDAEV